jgi:DNA ligase-1
VCRQALSAATGRAEGVLKKEYEASGDLGVVAAGARATQRTMFKPAPLTLQGEAPGGWGRRGACGLVAEEGDRG